MRILLARVYFSVVTYRSIVFGVDFDLLLLFIFRFFIKFPRSPNLILEHINSEFFLFLIWEFPSLKFRQILNEDEVSDLKYKYLRLVNDHFCLDRFISDLRFEL